MIEHQRCQSPADASQDRGGVVVTLNGELDLATLPSLSQMLASSNALEQTDLVVDLSEVTFMDAASAKLFIRAGTMLAERSCTLVLRSPQPMVWKVLVFCGATVAQAGILPAKMFRVARTA